MRETEYGPLPERMRLIILPISIFGAIGTPGQALARPLSARAQPPCGGVRPAVTPASCLLGDPTCVGPMIRMALTHAVRRGLGASIHTHWHRESLVAGGGGDEAMPPAPPAGGPPPGFIHSYGHRPPAGASLASLATPAFMAALMAWQAECMRDDGSFGVWLRPSWRFDSYSRSRSRSRCSFAFIRLHAERSPSSPSLP